MFEQCVYNVCTMCVQCVYNVCTLYNAESCVCLLHLLAGWVQVGVITVIAVCKERTSKNVQLQIVKIPTQLQLNPNLTTSQLDNWFILNPLLQCYTIGSYTR